MLSMAQTPMVKRIGRLGKMAAIFLPILIGISLVTAYAAPCSKLVREALNNIAQTCNQLGMNMACYAQDKVYTTLREQTSEVSFDKPSDLAALHHLESIRTAEIDAALQQWGIAVMKVQANLANTLPGQGIIFVMVGDVAIDNEAEDAETNYAPMQTFHLTTGTGHLQCIEAPSALVVQGPNDLTVNINANGVDIDISSTLMLTQVDANHMRLTTLSGEVKATNPGGDVVFLPEGYSVAFEVDEEGQMVGTFDFPQPISAYDAELSDILSETDPAILHYPIPGHGDNPHIWPVNTGAENNDGSSIAPSNPSLSRDRDNKKRSNKDSRKGKGGRGNDDGDDDD